MGYKKARPSGPGFSGAQLTQIIGTKEGERGGPVLHHRQADGAHAAAVPVGGFHSEGGVPAGERGRGKKPEAAPEGAAFLYPKTTR